MKKLLMFLCCIFAMSTAWGECVPTRNCIRVNPLVKNDDILDARTLKTKREQGSNEIGDCYWCGESRKKGDEEMSSACQNGDIVYGPVGEYWKIRVCYEGLGMSDHWGEYKDMMECNPNKKVTRIGEYDAEHDLYSSEDAVSYTTRTNLKTVAVKAGTTFCIKPKGAASSGSTSTTPPKKDKPSKTTTSGEPNKQVSQTTPDVQVPEQSSTPKVYDCPDEVLNVPASCTEAALAYADLKKYCESEARDDSGYYVRKVDVQNKIAACEQKKQEGDANKLRGSIKQLETKIANGIGDWQSKLSVWKTSEGNFNGARLASDSIAGVVLGTAGGLITSNLVKKGQIKSGFEGVQCTIGGQRVADWHDEFTVGIR